MLRHRRSIVTLVIVLVMLGASLAPANAAAAPFPISVITPGHLMWGGDQEGGGPYVYPADDDPSRVVGFEVELAEKLAAYVGLRAAFFQFVRSLDAVKHRH